MKRPVKRRQRAPRPASPYSTDSNYSAILAAAPHKPYPKSERRRQLASGRQGRHHGRHGNSGNQGSSGLSPALRPLPRECSTTLFFVDFHILVIGSRELSALPTFPCPSPSGSSLKCCPLLAIVRFR